MSLIKLILKQIRKQFEYRNAVDQLSRMTDRELYDIGINRADIHDVVHKDMAKKSR
jgi:uncharacterized protein YjiS (DUF1127 family)